MDDDTTSVENTIAAESADDTIVVPDVTPTGVCELAWSNEVADTVVDAPSAYHSVHLWGLAAAALVVAATAVIWFGVDLYYARSVTPATPSTPTAERAPHPTAVPRAIPEPPAPAPKTETVTASPPVTVTVTPKTVAAPATPRLPEPPPNAYAVYVGLLSRDGIVPTSSAEQMHDEAYYFCLAVDTGNTDAIQTLIEKSQQKSLALGTTQIRAMYADVVQAYCPQLADRPW